MVILSMQRFKKYFFLIFLIGFLGNNSMDNPENPQNVPDDRYFKIYGQEGEDKGIEVPWEILKLCSVIRELIEDLGGGNQSSIPISDFSIKTISLTMDILKKYVLKKDDWFEEFKNKPTADIIDVINCMNFLGVDEKILKEVGENVSDKLKVTGKEKKIDYQSFKNINFDAMRAFTSFNDLVRNIINSIENIILEKNKPYRKDYISDAILAEFSGSNLYGIFLHNDQWIALSSGDPKEKMGNICIYDVLTHNRLIKIDCNFVPYKLVSHENKYLVCGKIGGMRIFNIEDPQNIVFVDYNGPHSEELPQIIEFSPDGKYLVSAYDGDVNNLSIIEMDTINWKEFSIGAPHILTAMKRYQGAACSFFTKADFIIVTYNKPALHLAHLNCKDWRLTISSSYPKDDYHSSLFGFLQDSSLLAMSAEVGSFSKEIIIFHPIDFIFDKKIKVSAFDGNVTFLLFKDAWIIGLNNNGYFVYDYKSGQQIAKIKELKSNRSIAISKDKNRILFVGKNDKKCAMLWTLFSNEEKEALHKCSAQQIMLIQWVCMNLNKERGALISEGTTEYTIFMSLNGTLQNLLKRIGVEIKSAQKSKKSNKWRPF